MMRKRKYQSQSAGSSRVIARGSVLKPDLTITLRRSFPDWKTIAGVAIIILTTVLVYWPCRNGKFLWDERGLISENPLVKDPHGLYRIWFTSDAVDYWPLTNTLFWIQWAPMGNNTVGYHVTNLALHIANALLIWLILRRLTIPGAFWAALLFAVHPVNVESVAWISELKNVLAVFFFLLSVLWYLKFDQLAAANRSSRIGVKLWYSISLLAFTLAMLSKGSVAILPLILLLILWWQHGRVQQCDLFRTAPFFVVAGALTCVNVWFQTHGLGDVIRNATFTQRMLGAGYCGLVLPLQGGLARQFDVRLSAMEYRRWQSVMVASVVGMCISHCSINMAIPANLESNVPCSLDLLLRRPVAGHGLDRRIFHEVFLGRRSLPIHRHYQRVGSWGCQVCQTLAAMAAVDTTCRGRGISGR